MFLFRILTSVIIAFFLLSFVIQGEKAELKGFDPSHPQPVKITLKLNLSYMASHGWGHVFSGEILEGVVEDE